MRFLVISQYFWPEVFKINDVVQEMTARGHKVTVLTGLPNYPDGHIFEDYKKNIDKFKNYNGAEIVRVPLIPRGKGKINLFLNYLSFALSATFIGAYKLRKIKFNSILVYEPSPITVGIPAAFFRKIKRVPVIFWVQDIWPDTLKAVGVVKSKVVLNFIGLIVAFVYKNSDLILAQSKSFIPQIKKYTSNDKKIEYFPGWAEPIFLDFYNIKPADEIVIEENSFNILFAGNIGEAQDFPAILKTVELLRESKKIKWYILGDGRSAKLVKNQIKEKNLDDNITMLGRFDLERVPSFFKHADVLLVCLKNEPIFSMTIPSKIQAYLCSGIPMIGMLNGEGAELIKDNNAGFFSSSGDSVGLAEIIKKISAMSKEELNVIGKNGKILSKNEFNRDLLMDKLESWLVDGIKN